MRDGRRKHKTWEKGKQTFRSRNRPRTRVYGRYTSSTLSWGVVFTIYVGADPNNNNNNNMNCNHADVERTPHEQRTLYDDKDSDFTRVRATSNFHTPSGKCVKCRSLFHFYQRVSRMDPYRLRRLASVTFGIREWTELAYFVWMLWAGWCAGTASYPIWDEARCEKRLCIHKVALLARLVSQHGKALGGKESTPFKACHANSTICVACMVDGSARWYRTIGNVVRSKW